VLLDPRFHSHTIVYGCASFLVPLRSRYADVVFLSYLSRCHLGITRVSRGVSGGLPAPNISEKLARAEPRAFEKINRFLFEKPSVDRCRYKLGFTQRQRVARMMQLEQWSDSAPAIKRVPASILCVR